MSSWPWWLWAVFAVLAFDLILLAVSVVWTGIEYAKEKLRR